MNMIVYKILFCFFISLLTALIVDNSRILAGINCIFLKKHPRPNLRGFQYKIWTSVKKLGNQLLSKTNFSVKTLILG